MDYFVYHFQSSFVFNRKNLYISVLNQNFLLRHTYLASVYVNKDYGKVPSWWHLDNKLLIMWVFLTVGVGWVCFGWPHITINILKLKPSKHIHEPPQYYIIFNNVHQTIKYIWIQFKPSLYTLTKTDTHIIFWDKHLHPPYYNLVAAQGVTNMCITQMLHMEVLPVSQMKSRYARISCWVPAI